MNEELTKLLETAKSMGITKEKALEFIKEKSGDLLDKFDSSEIKSVVDKVFDKASNVDLSDTVKNVKDVASKIGDIFNK